MFHLPLLHQICNSKLLTDESTVDADIDQVIYVMPILRIEQPTVTNNHIQTLQNIINQVSPVSPSSGALSPEVSVKIASTKNLSPVQVICWLDHLFSLSVANAAFFYRSS